MTNIIDYLANFYPTELREKNWNIDHNTGVWLSDFIIKHNLHTILELGTSVGVSASYLALSTTGIVTTIESNPARFNQANINFSALKITNIISLQNHAPECFKTLNDDFDFVFIDCIKMYYKEFTEYCIHHFRQLRYIILDNTSSHKNQLTDFFEYINQYNYKTVEIGSGLVVITIS